MQFRESRRRSPNGRLPTSRPASATHASHSPAASLRRSESGRGYFAKVGLRPPAGKLNWRPRLACLILHQVAYGLIVTCTVAFLRLPYPQVRSLKKQAFLGLRRGGTEPANR